ncbi:Nucleophile aminohydrolase [Phytophthora cactorum]|nr:Nucleophile aminohydrolase [Phytophthora cactorum]
MADSAYSFSLTTFNPSGKLLQIEYALNAVNTGGKTSLGIRCKNGVVIATEKKLPTILVDEDSHKKIARPGPDYRVLVRKARKKAQTYFQKYKEHAPAGILVREIAAVMQEFTQSLYQIDPSGPISAGKPRLLARIRSVPRRSGTGEMRYNDDLEIEDAIHTALLTLREGFEAKGETNIEVGIIKEDKRRADAEVKDYLEQAE